MLGQTGPTLPDLQLISGASLQEASWLFTSFNIGYLVVCALAGLSKLCYMIRASLRENRSSGFPTGSDTNRAVQPQKIARGLKFRI